MTVISLNRGGHSRIWNCECICGNKCISSTNHLKNNHTKSCGCKKGIRTGNEQRIKKMRQTMLEKYGVLNAMHDKNIALKNAKSQNNSFILSHWKNNDEIICQGSYERRTIEWLNVNKIDYQWQPKIFAMPDGRTYRPDLFLIKDQKWIEIKGFMRNDAQEKFNWFISFNHCELWDKNKLKEIGVLNG